MSQSTRTTIAGLFIDHTQSTFDAVAVCRRPPGSGPPVTMAIAADTDTAQRLVWADRSARLATEAAAEATQARARLAGVAADLVGARADLVAMTAANKGLEAQIEQLSALLAVARAATTSQPAAPVQRAGARRAGAVKPDYRSAADVWLSGDVLVRPQRAAFKKSRGPQSVLVTFDDGIVMRVTTYLDGQAGLNQAAQFCRSSRQGQPESQVDRLRRRAVGIQNGRIGAQWIRDTKGCWRLVDIRPCPDVIVAEFVEE